MRKERQVEWEGGERNEREGGEGVREVDEWKGGEGDA